MVKYNDKPVPRNSNIAVIIDYNNNIKNVVISKFLSLGYRISAFNAADLFDMKDYKDVKTVKSLNIYNFPLDKSFNNIYKMNVYNYELNKAEVFSELSKRYDVQYVMLLELRDWQYVSWARVIDVRNYNVIYIENYTTKYSDNIESVIDHFAQGMSGK
jgi:hypothetical protein